MRTNQKGKTTLLLYYYLVIKKKIIHMKPITAPNTSLLQLKTFDSLLFYLLHNPRLIGVLVFVRSEFVGKRNDGSTVLLVLVLLAAVAGVCSFAIMCAWIRG